MSLFSIENKAIGVVWSDDSLPFNGKTLTQCARTARWMHRSSILDDVFVIDNYLKRLNGIALEINIVSAQQV